jgi:hypothetical protein
LAEWGRGQGKGFGSGVVGIQDEIGARGERRCRRLKEANGVRGGDGKRRKGGRRGEGARAADGGRGQGLEIRAKMIAERGNKISDRRETGCGQREEADWANANADPSATVNDVGVESISGGPGLQTPRGSTPVSSDNREGSAAVEIVAKSDEEEETGQVIVEGEGADDGKEGGVEPRELGGRAKVGARAIKTRQDRVKMEKRSERRIRGWDGRGDGSVAK